MTDTPESALVTEAMVDAACDAAERHHGIAIDPVIMTEALEAALSAQSREIKALEQRFPLGSLVRFKSDKGPQWQGKVCGYYSTEITPEGLVVECDAEGARGIVHVDPAKRFILRERGDQSHD